MKLYFEAFDRAWNHVDLAEVAATIERTYETGGACTHVAFPDGTGEVVLAFPLVDGERFVAVVGPRELRFIRENGDVDDGVDEFYLAETDDELEDGVESRMSLI